MRTSASKHCMPQRIKLAAQTLSGDAFGAHHSSTDLGLILMLNIMHIVLLRGEIHVWDEYFMGEQLLAMSTSTLE